MNGNYNGVSNLVNDLCCVETLIGHFGDLAICCDFKENATEVLNQLSWDDNYAILTIVGKASVSL